MTRRKVEPGKPCPYKAGRDYALQRGRGKHEEARILITHVRREPLGSILEEEAKAEGFGSREEFFEWWEGYHGYCSPEREVWVIEFKLVEAPEEAGC
jgi:hypothetical protein